MYVRLGFAISAHLDPDILIVDEVLAVGDADFQKKSLGKMKEVASKEKTILFVSHNLTAVANLCNKTLHLEKGYVKQFGETGEVLNNYLSAMQNNLLEQSFDDIEEAPGNDLVRLKYAKLTPALIENQIIADVRNALKIDIEFWNLLDDQNLNISLHIFASTGECIFNVGTQPELLNKGVVQASLTIPGYFLNDGNYLVSFMIVKDKSIVLFNFEDALIFPHRSLRNTCSVLSFVAANSIYNITIEEVKDNTSLFLTKYKPSNNWTITSNRNFEGNVIFRILLHVPSSLLSISNKLLVPTHNLN
jgi:lipopolysaccharide transport system ATP-binding protein